MQALKRLVQPAGGPEEGQAKRASGVLDTVAQHIQGGAATDLAREPREEAFLHLRAVVLPQLLPLLRLGGQDEVNHVTREEAEPAVVVLRPAFPIAARRAIAVGRERLANGHGVPRTGVGPVLEERALDRFLEASLGDLGVHSGSVPSFRMAR